MGKSLVQAGSAFKNANANLKAEEIAPSEAANTLLSLWLVMRWLSLYFFI